MNVSMNWGNSIREFERAVRNSSKVVQEGIARVVDDTGKEVKRLAEAGTPVDTGKLRRGWRLKSSGRGRKRIAIIDNPVPYAAIIENGTRKRAPRRMLQKAFIRGERGLKRRLKALERKTAQTFNRG